jgi:hypothetical protein
MEDYAVGAAAHSTGTLKWPFLKWAGGKEDKYFAHLARNMISVYEAPEMTMLNKKSIKMEGVQVGWDVDMVGVMGAHCFVTLSITPCHACHSC